jgi:hypothetical protein
MSTLISEFLLRKLENLTKIRHDHAISALRELDHKNVHRHGRQFHNWISIYFN